MSVRVGDEIVAGGQGDMYTKAQVDALIANAIAQTTEKPGMIKPFAGTTVPTGYLLCDGSAVSRTTYANLFAAIGTTYGSGDGSTTFNLPNYNNGYPLAKASATEISLGLLIANAGLPKIVGTIGYLSADTSNDVRSNGASGVLKWNSYHSSGVPRTTTATSGTFDIKLDTTLVDGTVYNRTDSTVYSTRNLVYGGWLIKY